MMVEHQAGGHLAAPTSQSSPRDSHDANTSDPEPSLAVMEKQDVLRKSIISVTDAHSSLSPSPEPKAEQPQVPVGPPFQREALENYKPKTAKFWLILLSIYLSVFIVALDRTILSTAIPQITNDFKSLGDIGSYGSVYMLVTAAFQLVFGKIYRFYDLRGTLLSTIVLFEIGSVICGTAPTSSVFMLGRAVAGFGSAGIMTGAMIVIITMVPLHKRPMYQSVLGIIFGVSSAVGPLLGGALTQKASWRWCFYINLPVGVVTVACLFFFLTSPKRPSKPASIKEHIIRLDPLGTLFFVPALVSLVLVLKWGGSKYSWSDWRVIVLFVAAGLSAVAFVVVQIMMPKTASLPIRIIKQRSMWAGTGFLILLSGAMFMCIYYVPLWFQAAHGLQPLQSGINTLPLVLSLAVSAVGSSAFTQAVGYYVPSMMICPCLMAIGEGLLTTLTPTAGPALWVPYQLLIGLGIGFGMQTVALAVQATLAREDIPTGIAITFWAQQMGGAIFVSVGQTILNSLLSERLSHLPGLNSELLIETGATQLHDVVPPGSHEAVASAFSYAGTRIFLAAAVLSAVQVAFASAMEWKNIKKGAPGPP